MKLSSGENVALQPLDLGWQLRIWAVTFYVEDGGVPEFGHQRIQLTGEDFALAPKRRFTTFRLA